jgi:outer membrane protein insertion porin family
VARLAALLCACGGTVALAQPLNPDDRAKAQPPAAPAPAPATMQSLEGLADRPVRAVRLLGLSDAGAELAQRVQNQIRTRAGTPLNPETVREDVQRLNRLGRFKEINARAQVFDDGSVEIVYEFTRTPVIHEVDIVGNRQVANSELQPAVANIQRDTPVDEYQLGAARNAIERIYRDKGYYQATVTIDQKELEKNNTILFRVAEGERVRVTDIRFEGNRAFEPRQLEPSIKTKTAGLFETGPVDNEQLDRDVQALVEFYRDRGYLDVRADRRVVFSPNGKEAIVTFVLDEGPLYTLRNVRVEVAGNWTRPGQGKAPTVLSREQVAGLMDIKEGDVYSVDRIRRSVDAVRNAYTGMGYADARVEPRELRDPAQPLVDLLLIVREGEAFRTGLITVKGNDITKDSVIYRELDIRPDRPLSIKRERTGERLVTEPERRLTETRLFEPGSVRLTVQPEDPANPGYRDVLVEMKETNTGSLSFGAGVSSDAGVVGLISLHQRNFDLADVPDSWSELFAGRAFRGAGQDFDITVAPGNEVQTYSISLTDPALLDTEYTGSVTGFYRKREFDQYDEGRLGGTLALGRKFGERWVGSVSFRAENVDVSKIDADAPVDLFAVKGGNALTSLGLTLQRTTTDSRFRPTRGSRISLSAERIGALGGDYDFTRLSAEHGVFFPIYESFLGYKTVLSFKTRVGYIPEGNDKSPLFERFYLGGTTFRGFRFRTVSPKGIRNDTKTLGDDPVGGSWLFFAGTEVQQPIYKDIVSGVVFIDSGTVTEDPGFDDYRVSVGVGLRLHIEQLGPVPLAFDFGFPVKKGPGDKQRIFSFSIDLPF